MIKKTLITLFSLTLILFIFLNNPVLAEICINSCATNESNYVINVTDRLQSQTENHVKTDQVVNLVVNNNSSNVFDFSIPMMNINVEVPKETTVVIPVKFYNLNSDEIWFTARKVKEYNGKPIFELTYQVTAEAGRIACEDNRNLFEISYYPWVEIYMINKEICTADGTCSKSNCIPVEPSTPNENTVTTEPTSAHNTKIGGYVRGYW